MATAIMTVVAIVFFVVPEFIMAFFTNDYGAIDMGRTFFMIIALTEPIMALINTAKEQHDRHHWHRRGHP